MKVLEGVDVLADNVASTYGPRGLNVILQEKDKDPFVTKDGVTVARFVHLDDPFMNAGAQIIKQAAIQTNNDAGDVHYFGTCHHEESANVYRRWRTSGCN